MLQLSDNGHGDDHATARLISRLLGWSYFLLWSLSFYPQPLHHIRRRSTHGFSLDFAVANIVGLTCYAVANALLLYSPEVRQEYAIRHPSAPEPPVAFNDLAYAVHGSLLMVLVLTQFVPRIWGFDMGSKTRPSRAMLIICGTSMLAVFVSAACVGSIPPLASHSRPWAWLDVADTLSNAKVLLTVIKYAPQAWTNYRLQSTAGFNMVAVGMDVVGAMLSLLQLAIDAAVVGGGDWSDLTNNPGKFGLGNVSLAFDAVFLWQHFVLYRDSWTRHKQANDDAEAGRLVKDDELEAERQAAATEPVAGEQTPLLSSTVSRSA